MIRSTLKLVCAVCCLSIVLPQLSCCQDQDSVLRSWITAVSAYRDFILLSKPQSADELKELFDTWNQYEAAGEEQAALTLSLLKLKEVDQLPFKAIKRILCKNMPSSKLVRDLTERQLEIIAKNSELLDLVHLGVLRAQFPFNINPETQLFDELRFYDIHAGEAIGEIGAGSGTFAVLLCMIEPSTTVYINELSSYYLNYIGHKIEINKELLRSKDIVLVNGNKKKTNIGEQKLDKVIVRNTIHHFRKKEKMLSSIHAALKEEGELCIRETFLESDPEGHSCDELMPERDLMVLLQSAHFRVVSQKRLGKNVLLKLEKHNRRE